MHPGRLKICGAGGWVEWGGGVRKQSRDAKIPRGKKISDPDWGPEPESLDPGLGPDLLNLLIPCVHAQTFTAGYEGLQVRASSSLAAFLSLLPIGKAVPRGLGVGIGGIAPGGGLGRLEVQPCQGLTCPTRLVPREFL